MDLNILPIFRLILSAIEKVKQIKHLMISPAQEILRKHFGFEQSRPQPAEIIERVLDKKDALVLMPTGGRKSLCFQVPALLMNRACIVVSPLVSPMKDKVAALEVMPSGQMPGRCL